MMYFDIADGLKVGMGQTDSELGLMPCRQWSHLHDFKVGMTVRSGLKRSLRRL